jgi:hypothetical protein
MGHEGRTTTGPWQVVEEKIPHHRGGFHVERRIFTAWDHPQLHGPVGVVNCSIGIGEKEGGPARYFVHIEEADAALIAAAPYLLSEIERVRTALHIEGQDSNTDPVAVIEMLRGWEADAQARSELLEKHLSNVLEIARTWQPDYATKMDRATLSLAQAELTPRAAGPG